MKKILFLINALDAGGAERVLINTANGLAKEYDITVMTISRGGSFREQLNDNVKYRSIVHCNNKLLKRIFVYLISFVLSPNLVHKLFIGNRYDYEVAFLEGVPTKLIAASGNGNSVKYAWVHIDLYNTFGIEKVHKNIYAHIECYRKLDKIICVSESVKEAFIKRFGIAEKLEVKYNTIDDEEIKRKAVVDVPQNTEFTIVFVGRLTEQKGVDRLLRIHKRLTCEGYKYKLDIVGDGVDREKLEAFTAVNKLDYCTEFIGFTDNPYRYMYGADMLVYPSRAEGYSTVVAESVILGKPIVVSDCSGMREMLGDSEFGMVVDNNEESLYRGIKSMLSDAELRNQYANNAKIRSRDFTMTSRLEEIRKLFKEFGD